MSTEEDKLREDFNTLLPSLIKWMEKVKKFLDEDLKGMTEQLKVKIPSSFREKNIESFIGKALYRMKSYTDPMIDIEDKVAGRVVFLISKDVNEAYGILEKDARWNCKTTRNIEKEIGNQPNSFDYQSIHVVVSPIDSDKDFSEDEKKYLTCEIQLRTLLQHAYAEMSHDNVYKGPFKNDKKILRHLAKSMALMEAADDYFCRILDQMIDKDRPHKAYFDNLLKLFKIMVPDFDDSEIDWGFTSDVFALFTLKEISIEEINDFVEKTKSKINLAISDQKHITRQPAFLLLAYYLLKHPKWLDKQELPELTLKVAKNALGVSSGRY